MEREINTALLLIDVQNDFCPGGKLPVKEGDQVVEPLNEMIKLALENNWPVLASRDWHPAKTTHFVEFGGLWPEHCVENTLGAAFHPDLWIAEACIVTKGHGEKQDAYSAFDGKLDNGQTLEEFLKAYRIKRVLVGGLATDYCVKATAIEAARKSFHTYLLTDAIRAVNLKPEDGQEALQEMRKAGVDLGTTEQVIRWEKYKANFC